MPRDGIFGDPILVFTRGLPGRHPNVAADYICDMDPRLVGAGGHGKGTGAVEISCLLFFFVKRSYIVVGSDSVTMSRCTRSSTASDCFQCPVCNAESDPRCWFWIVLTSGTRSQAPSYHHITVA